MSESGERKPLKGRGALSNPAGRFESAAVEDVDDGWHVEEQPDSIATSVLPDRARALISTNDSPDIPFEQSINPYRGCEHGCVYCVQGDTKVLMGDGTTRPIADLRVGDEIYGTARRGRYRRYVKSHVVAHWSVIKRAYRLSLTDGTQIVAGGDHRFLTERGWKFVTGSADPGSTQRPYLTLKNKLMGTGGFAVAVVKDNDYRRGYLCGMIRGDGHLASHQYQRANGRQDTVHGFRLALCDAEGLQRTQEYLQSYQVSTREFLFQQAAGCRRARYGIRTAAYLSVEQIRRLTAWPIAPAPAWSAGFLAGIFDAEGSYSQCVLRISNTDHQIIEWIIRCLTAFDFRVTVERVAPTGRKPIEIARLIGGLREQLRFFHTVDPAIRRKLSIEGQALKSDARLRVVGIEPLGTMRLYDVTTSTEDFIANGVVSHNCYARPSHAYMGLSAGLDFETRLFYKADAARVLHSELSRPGYVCKPITLGANTDPYQPVERRLRVTRSILEVLAATRHPVSVITKSASVLRDLDLLTDLARDNLTSVSISITSLDPETKRTLEPRAASPHARLGALRQLARAGIPVGVMVAPVIPALTDHELESILDAAAAAGARWAGYVMLRLPYEVKDLFREWLAQHHPQRAAHVMSLIQDVRGGRDNDPRFGTRMRGTGPVAELVRSRFKLACRRLGLDSSRASPANTALFRPPGAAGGQMTLGF